MNQTPCGCEAWITWLFLKLSGMSWVFSFIHYTAEAGPDTTGVPEWRDLANVIISIYSASSIIVHI